MSYQALQRVSRGKGMKTRTLLQKMKVTGTHTLSFSQESVCLWGPEGRSMMEFSALKVAQELIFAVHCKVRRIATS